MSSTGCDPCCRCLELRAGVRVCAVLKAGISALSFVLPSLMIIFMIVPSSDPDHPKDPCLIISFAVSFIFMEVLNIFFSIFLGCLAGKKPATNLYILCSLMIALNLLYLAGVVVVGFYATPGMLMASVSFFLVSAALTLYTTLVVWGLVKHEKNAKDEPADQPEAMVTADQPSGYDYTYGAPVYYAQPYQVQSYEAQQFQTQPYQLQQPYEVQKDRSKAYGIQAARGGQQ